MTDSSFNVSGVSSGISKAIGFGSTAVVANQFTRPDNSVAYVLNDLVANSPDPASVNPLVFTVSREPGLGGMIRRVRLHKSDPSTTRAQFALHLYDRRPVLDATSGDNGPWLASAIADGQMTYLGQVNVTTDKVATDGCMGIGVPDFGGEINFNLDTVYALLVARNAYQPAPSEVFTVELEVLQN